MLKARRLLKIFYTPEREGKADSEISATYL